MTALAPMILVGMFDSPFVRRVAVSLRVLGLPFEHRNLSVGKDEAQIRALNPLGRVPVLVLPSGESLIESAMILDHLDALAGSDRALLPPAGEARRAAQQWLALATGALDKGIQLVYEQVFRPVDKQHQPWTDRCRRQMDGALAELDARCAAIEGSDWLVGARIGQADITLACFCTYLRDAVPVDLAPYAALRARCERIEDLRALREFYLPFEAPVPVVPALVVPAGRA